MIYKNCEACFKKFPINHAQKYCSKTCAKEGRLKKRKLWFKNSEKGKAQIQKQLTVWNINYRKTKSGKEANKRYVRKKISNDPAYKMGQNFRKRLWIFIKRGNKKFTKRNSTYKMIGCTAKFLKEYIEARFKPGMNWENYSKEVWHIDHIKPLSSAKNNEDMEKLMHYTNLQPLWAKDNLSKGDKF